ncbi:MAG: ABC transporter substrate-binding protein [Terrimesophilobacter sp.]
MKFRRIGMAAGAIALVSAMALTGCTPAENAGSPAGDGDPTAIITANSSEPQNPLIPTNTNEVGGGKILDAMFAGLIYYDKDGAAHNDVADSITTDDNITFTVKIKPGLKFTNGDPVDAESFVTAWKYGALASNAQLSSYFFEDIEGFSYDEDTDLTGLNVVDDTTFTIKLTSALADFPLRLGYSAFYPLPKSAWADVAAFGENPSGNGPYMFANDKAWQHDVQIDLVVNPDYDGPRKATNGGITFTFYQSQDSAYADLLSGNLDVLDAIPNSAFATFQSDLGDRAVNQPAAIFQSFTIPSRLAHFSGEEGNLRRKAISMAINREEITTVIFEGTRTPASDFSSPVIDGWTDKLKGAEVLAYNPDEAKKLWAEADAIAPWTGQFQIAYNADGGHQAWVDAVLNSVKNTLGIDAVGAPYPTFKEARTLITKREIQTPFRTGWQADYPGLFNFLGPLYATNAGSNDGDYSNPEFDALLKKGSTASDLKEANADFQKAQEILLQDLPVLPLWYSNVTGGFGTDVSNVNFGWNSVPLYYEITKK